MATGRDPREDLRRWGTDASSPKATSSGATDAVARCLLREEGKTAGVADWYGSTGEEYRRRAEAVLQTLGRLDSGIASGGLPPERPRVIGDRYFGIRDEGWEYLGSPVFSSEAVPKGEFRFIQSSPSMSAAEVEIGRTAHERLRRWRAERGATSVPLSTLIPGRTDPPRYIPPARLGRLREALALRIAPWLR